MFKHQTEHLTESGIEHFARVREALRKNREMIEEFEAQRKALDERIAELMAKRIKLMIRGIEE